MAHTPIRKFHRRRALLPRSGRHFRQWGSGRFRTLRTPQHRNQGDLPLRHNPLKSTPRSPCGIFPHPSHKNTILKKISGLPTPKGKPDFFTFAEAGLLLKQTLFSVQSPGPRGNRPAAFTRLACAAIRPAATVSTKRPPSANAGIRISSPVSCPARP